MKRQFANLTANLAVPICIIACSGCASFFGPYVPEKELYSNQTAAQPAPEAGTASEFDASSRTAKVNQEPDFPTTVDAADLAGAIAEPLIEQHSQDAKPTFDDFCAPATEAQPAAATENPFAEMERHSVLQTSAKMPHASSSAGTVTMAGGTTASTFRAAEARVPTAATAVSQECCCAPSPEAKAYPDEYICDGGDRGHPVHYFGDEMQGLDTEDTVAEFKDQDGKNHVQASNRVCVYAPRFGAVRTVSGPGIGVKIDKAAGGTDIAGIGALESQRGMIEGVHRSIASGVGSNQSANGVENSQPAHAAEKTDEIIQTAKVDQGLESKVSLGLNLLRTTDVHELNLQILEPGKSSTQTGFGMSGSTTQATQTYSTFRVQATVGSEKGARPGKIHITKEASPRIAKAGDIITFTIQFRNVGDYNVQEVRIIDNLTPRLTYVDGTGQIDVGDGAGGGLTVLPNKEGSQTLIFELDEPLKGGESGSITFEAKVL
jgi:uncharacterized repeat protein (TIGR01451 family)